MKFKKITYFVGIAFLQFCLAIGTIFIILTAISCSEDQNNFPNSEKEIGFYVKGINDMKTRAGYDSPTDITADDPGFGIYLTDGSFPLASQGNRADNHNMKMGNSTWFDYTAASGGGQMLWSDDPDAIVNAYAYCPYIPNINDINNIQVRVLQDQSTLAGLKASDFLRATTFGNCSGNSNFIPLTFSHQFSKIRLNIKYESDTPGEISSVNVKAASMGNYDLATGTLTSIETSAQEIKAYYDKSTGGSIVEVIVLPQTFKAGHELVQISITINNKPFNYLYSLGETALITKPNTLYNFDLKLTTTSSGKLILPSVSKIEEWGETINQGDFTVDKSHNGLNILNLSFSDFRAQTDGLSLFVNPTHKIYTGTELIGIAIDGKIYHNPRGFKLSTEKQSAELSTYQNNLGGSIRKISFYTWDENHNLVTNDTLRIENQVFVFNPKEIFIPTTILITPEYNRETSTLTLKTSSPLPFPITYRLLQKYRNENDETITPFDQNIIIPQGATSKEIDLSAWNKEHNALLTHQLTASETKYSYCNYLTNGYFFVLVGSFWGVDNDNYQLHIVL